RVEAGPETLGSKALFQGLRVEREQLRVLEETARRSEQTEGQLALLRTEADGQLAVLRSEVDELTAALARLSSRCSTLENEGRAASAELSAIRRSTAFRLMTAPGRMRRRLFLTSS